MTKTRMAERVIKMRVTSSAEYTVSETDLFHALIDMANATKAGQWLDKDRRGKVVVMEEHYTSHRFDAEADDQSPDRIKELEAAQALLSALQTYRKVTGRL